MNTEELKDIIECILKFDSTATDMQKARYFDIIQKDLKRVVKLLATPAVSKCEGIEGRGLLQAYFKWHKEMGFVSHKPEDIDEFLSLQ